MSLIVEGGFRTRYTKRAIRSAHLEAVPGLGLGYVLTVPPSPKVD